MPRLLSHFAWFLTLPITLAGCGALLETAQVEGRFNTLFQCQSARTVGEVGGYRVEGCGRVAHFRCIDIDSHRHDRRHNESIGEAVIESLVDGFFSSDTCVLEYTSEVSPRPQREGPATVATQKTPKGPIVRTRIMLPGGYMTLLGKPTEHAAYALITLHSTDRLEPAPCSAELYHDGVPVPIEQLTRSSEYDVRLLVRVAALRDIDHAVRFAGEACGETFELDEHARTTLGLFEARFREELARSQATVANSSVTERTPSQQRTH